MKAVLNIMLILGFVATTGCLDRPVLTGVYKLNSPDRLKFTKKLFSARQARTIKGFARLPNELKHRKQFVLLQPHRTSNDSHIVYKLPNDADTLLIEFYIKKREYKGRKDKNYYTFTTHSFIAIMGKVVCDDQVRTGRMFNGANVWFSRSRMEVVVEQLFDYERKFKQPLWYRYELFSARRSALLAENEYPSSLRKLPQTYVSRARNYVNNPPKKKLNP